MPVVMKSSESGMVDPVTKTIRLPGYLGPRPESSKLARAVAIATLPLAAITFSSLPANANVVLTNGGVTASINTGGGTGPAGLNSLLINGQQQVEQQWFYYRTASSGAASSLDTLTAGVPIITDTGSSDIMDITYSGTYNGPSSTTANYTVELKYTLVGNSPNGASLNEAITINNSANSTTSLPMDFFQYNHFTLNNDTTHQSVTITSPTLHNTATQTDVATGSNTLETNVSRVVTPGGGSVPTQPDFYQASLFSTLNSTTFGGAGFTNLTDTAGPVGPGNVTYAFQWSTDPTTNGNIAIGGSEQISKNRTITVPEPAAAGIAMGAASLLMFARPSRRTRARG